MGLELGDGCLISVFGKEVVYNCAVCMYVCMYVCTVVEHDRVVFCMVRRRKMELL